jgi:MFS family permease
LFESFSFICGNFLFILTGMLLIDFNTEMANTYYPLYVTELGGTATTIGLIASASTLTVALVKIPGGNLADKYRRKKLIITMSLLASISYLLPCLGNIFSKILLAYLFSPVLLAGLSNLPWF